MKNIKKTFTITIFAENKPGVLYRVTNILLRKKINIESIHSFKDKTTQLTKIVLSFEELENIANKTIKQIEKIIEVIEIKI